ncbi:MAG: hypothetical protein GVY31_10470 [Alphaproteobacteria bacterium]|nr:hypothetical protein [Alphaproteobacteria bacterium]
MFGWIPLRPAQASARVMVGRDAAAGAAGVAGVIAAMASGPGPQSTGSPVRAETMFGWIPLRPAQASPRVIRRGSGAASATGVGAGWRTTRGVGAGSGVAGADAAGAALAARGWVGSGTGAAGAGCGAGVGAAMAAMVGSNPHSCLRWRFTRGTQLVVPPMPART